MILLIDADSLVVAACYGKEDVYPDGFIDDIELVKDRFHERFMGIFNTLEEVHGVDINKYKVFIGGRNNFRKVIFPKYKIKRMYKPKSPLLGAMMEYVASEYNAWVSHGCEADDSIAATLSYINEYMDDEAIVASIDKDLKQLTCNFFNCHFAHNTLEVIEPLDAAKNFYYQMAMGDSTDGVDGLKGIGDVKARRLVEDCVNEFGLRKKIYAKYLEEYGRRAKFVWREREMLLRLHTTVSHPTEFDERI